MCENCHNHCHGSGGKSANTGSVVFTRGAEGCSMPDCKAEGHGHSVESDTKKEEGKPESVMPLVDAIESKKRKGIIIIVTLTENGDPSEMAIEHHKVGKSALLYALSNALIEMKFTATEIAAGMCVAEIMGEVLKRAKK